MNESGRTMNQRNDAIADAWVRLWICITTNDINEFYEALSGHQPRASGKHYTWDTVNNAKPINKRKKDFKK